MRPPVRVLLILQQSTFTVASAFHFIVVLHFATAPSTDSGAQRAAPHGRFGPASRHSRQLTSGEAGRRGLVSLLNEMEDLVHHKDAGRYDDDAYKGDLNPERVRRACQVLIE